MNGGGILVNWGSYDLDYLLGLTGWTLQPRTVLARMWGLGEDCQTYAAPDSDAETHVVTTILCESGAAISFERGELVAASDDEAWQIIGSQGSLRLKMTADNQTKQIIYDRLGSNGTTTETIWSGLESTQPLYTGPIDDFTQAIIDNRQPATGLQQALVFQQITDAIYASCQQHDAIAINPPQIATSMSLKEATI